MSACLYADIDNILLIAYYMTGCEAGRYLRNYDIVLCRKMQNHADLKVKVKFEASFYVKGQGHKHDFGHKNLTEIVLMTFTFDVCLPFSLLIPNASIV